mmetsp:Transcript_23477/g.32762  ORF Transcript_23477/g.32762 Transcript_23477/m.32762 type:complete len:415 (-) Transcript_23477:2887-4131(-)
MNFWSYFKLIGKILSYKKVFITHYLKILKFTAYTPGSKLSIIWDALIGCSEFLRQELSIIWIELRELLNKPYSNSLKVFSKVSMHLKVCKFDLFYLVRNYIFLCYNLNCFQAIKNIIIKSIDFENHYINSHVLDVCKTNKKKHFTLSLCLLVGHSIDLFLDIFQHYLSKYALIKMFDHLNTHSNNYYEVINYYSSFLKQQQQMHKSIIIREKGISKIPLDVRFGFIYKLFLDLHQADNISDNLRRKIIQKIIEQKNLQNSEVVLIVKLIFETHKKLLFSKNWLDAFFNNIIKKKFLEFRFLLYFIKSIGHICGLSKILDLIKKLLKSTISKRIKESDYIKLFLIIIYINDRLGNLSKCRKIFVYLLENVSKSFKLCVLKLYKTYEILYGNEESFRDYLYFEGSILINQFFIKTF